jgi:hypothetical protein
MLLPLYAYVVRFPHSSAWFVTSEYPKDNFSWSDIYNKVHGKNLILGYRVVLSCSTTYVLLADSLGDSV